MALGSPQWMYASGEAFTIDQSLRFNDDDSAYLSRTFATPTNPDIFTISCWVKRGNLSANSTDSQSGFFGQQGSDWGLINFDSNDKLFWRDKPSGADNCVLKTTRVFRDLSAWYHLVFIYDSSDGTEGDRAQIWVNGVRETVFDSGEEHYPSSSATSAWNTAGVRTIGGYNATTIEQEYDGCLAEVHFIDGTALTPTSFGETGDYGEWKPIEVSGLTYGTNGFYLPFKQDYTVEGFSATTYKGEGGTRYVGGTGFRPSLNWIKRRNGNGSHRITDIVRGAGKTLMSDDTGAEYVGNDTSAFKPDGFTNGGNSDDSGDTYVAWSWDMGANSPTGFGCVTYKGNGGTQSIGDVGFSPDLVWTKSRTSSHGSAVFDTISGGNNRLDTTSSQESRSNEGNIKFEPDGFSVTSSHPTTNYNNADMVSYFWNMGGTSVANTTGSINSTVRASTTYGQSIVSYTGTGSNATVGHGLSSAPEMIIVKRRSSSQSWMVYHAGIASDAETDAIKLNTTDAAFDDNSAWNDTAPTSSVFSLGTGGTNGSSETHIAYCFHSVSGYSKFGTYSGSGGSGNAQTLGFRPAFLMVKRTDSTSNWAIMDSTRSPLNPVDKALRGDASNAEDDLSSNYQVTFTDTGFSFSNYGYNETGSTYVYMAFAGGMDSISDYNDTGTIDSRVKANTTYGQSIVSYNGNATAGATLGHGLSSAPNMIILKHRDNNGESARVYHSGVTNGHLGFLNLNNTNAWSDNTLSAWNDTAPTSSVFSIGNDTALNGDGKPYIAWCFHNVTGYSSFGSYTGNGGSGTITVTTGFKPAWIMVKRTDSTSDWSIFDTTRQPSGDANNVLDESLAANLSNAVGTDNDFAKLTDTSFIVQANDYGFCNASGGTYIYAAFADKREYAYWLDQSGNNNDWTSNNLTESDISVDSPTNNFATFNPIDASGNDNTYSEGNLKVYLHNQGQDETVKATMGASSGKWYWEHYAESSTDDGGNFYVGIRSPDESNYWIVRGSNGEYETTGGTQGTNSAISYDVGDIVGVAVDLDNSKWWVSINGVFVGSPTSGTSPIHSNLSGTVLPTTQNANSGERHTFVVNFGQDSSFAGNKTAQGNQDGNDIGDFYYTPPTGYLALCTSNLPAVDVVPSEHFNIVTYSGDGATDQSITGVGFQPDFTWLKRRNASERHMLVTPLHTHTSGAYHWNDSASNEGDFSGGVGLGSFDSDGFTFDGSDATWNASGSTYVSWNWLAGNTTLGTGDFTQGDIASTCRRNVDAGFSIISYTGNGSSNQDVGHGLSKRPEMVFYKNRDENSRNWSVYHKDMNPSDEGAFHMNLNLTDARGAASVIFNDQETTATTIPVGTSSDNNDSGSKHIAYAFHSVDGFSKVGSWVGNGSTNGTFVYTGFRPAYLLLKASTRTGAWTILDNKRDVDNSVGEYLIASSSQAESTHLHLDFTSNGFKFRNNGGDYNDDGDTFVYIAFAETPFKYSNSR